MTIYCRVEESPDRGRRRVCRTESVKTQVIQSGYKNDDRCHLLGGGLQYKPLLAVSLLPVPTNHIVVPCAQCTSCKASFSQAFRKLFEGDDDDDDSDVVG